jgi:hypothetical protein
MTELQLTRRQVFYALDNPPSPKKKTGKPPALDADQR